MDVPKDRLPYTEPLVADLLVTYAFDLPGMFQMANRADFAELGIRPEEARAIAVANLKRVMPEIGIEEDRPVRRIVTGEQMEACTLLAGPFWDQIAAKMKGEVVVSVPRRDVVLFCSSKSATGIDAMRLVAAELLQEKTPHVLNQAVVGLAGWSVGRVPVRTRS
jgi:uncharacterized protein YtpQ (UPF0354 family)